MAIMKCETISQFQMLLKISRLKEILPDLFTWTDIV